MIVCPRCGQENPAGFRLCGMCGAPLDGGSASGRGERKVVTVLCVELSGVAAQAARRDPEEVHALAAPHRARVRSLVEHYGGTVDSIVGATAIALFGVSLAHEDDAERAVRAALRLRDEAAIGGLDVRAGIDTGQALVTGARAEGDVVNRALTLLGAAQAGDVAVGLWTYERSRQAIEYREALPVQERDHGRTLRIWKAVSPRARPGVDVTARARAPLVGRQDEIDALLAALDRVRRTRTPELVTLVGPPGIGKSRLVQELLAAVDADAELISWRQGRSLPYGEAAYWPLGEIVRAQAGILETDEADAAEAKLRHAVEALVRDPAEAEQTLAQLSPLAGIGGDADAYGDQRGEAFAVWRRFFATLAAERPLVLAFEDLHWADDGMLDFVEHLVAATEAVPLLVVATARPELLERRPDWRSPVAVDALSDADTAALLDELLLDPVEPSLREQVVARAAGNPLYAEQYARMLDERGPGEELPLPASVQDIVTARVDALGTGRKALLEDAAVIGRVFWAGGLADLAGVDRRKVERELEELERRELVQRSRQSSITGEVEYAFRHLLVQEIAYSLIPRAQRGEKHRLVAAWLQSYGRAEAHPELLAHHYLAALELARAAGGDAQALVGPARHALRDAGDRALALNAYAAAATSYGRALELWPRDDDARPLLLLRHAQALHCAGEEEAVEALDAAHRALSDAGRREAAAEADTLLAEALWLRGQRDRAFAHLNRARQLVRDSASSSDRARVLAAFGRYQTLAGEHEVGAQAAAEALDLAEGLGLAELQAHALNTLGLAKNATGDPTWVHDLERSVDVARRANSREAVRAVNNLASLVSNGGELVRATELWEETWELAQRFGDRQFMRFTDGTLIWVAYVTGDWNRAMRNAYAFVAECEAGSPHYQESAVRATRALIRHLRGDAEGALEDSARAVELAREVKDPQVLLPDLAARARVCAGVGREDEARAVLDEALLAAAAAGAGAISAFGDLLWAADRLGRQREVRDVVAGLPASPWRDAAVAVVGQDFARAAELYAAIGARAYEAEARLRAAAKLAADGRAAASGSELAGALEFFREVGATRSIAEAEGLLASA